MRPRSVLLILALQTILFLLASSAAAEMLVVANKAEATVSLIDLDSGKVTATLPTGEGPHEVAVTADGQRAIVTDYGKGGSSRGSSLTLIDLAKPSVLASIDLGDYTRPHGIAWLDDHRVVVTAEGAKAVIVVDTRSGKVLKAIDTDQEISHMLALAPDGRRAFIANIGSHSITAVDLVAGKRLANVPTDRGAEGIAVSGSQVWVTNRAADTVTVLDVDSLEKLAEFPSPGFPIRAVAAGDKILVTRARAGDMVIYDTAALGTDALAEGRVLNFELEAKDVEDRLFGDRFGDSSVPIGIAVDPDGKRAWVAHANADVITEVDLGSGKTLRSLTAGREPDGMAYSSVVASAE